MITAFLILCGFGAFGALCSRAPVWDEDRQAPAEGIDAAAERA